MQKDVIVCGKKGKEYRLGPDGLLLNPDSNLEYNSTDYQDKSKEKNNSNVENGKSKSGITEKNTEENKNSKKEDANNVEEDINNSNSIKTGQSVDDKIKSNNTKK